MAVVSHLRRGIKKKRDVPRVIISTYQNKLRQGTRLVFFWLMFGSTQAGCQMEALALVLALCLKCRRGKQPRRKSRTPPIRHQHRSLRWWRTKYLHRCRTGRSRCVRCRSLEMGKRTCEADPSSCLWLCKSAGASWVRCSQPGYPCLAQKT